MEEKNLTKEKRHRNRPDLKNFGQEMVQPGDNTKYLKHAMAAWDLPVLDINDDRAVDDRIKWYFTHCVEDDMKPTVSGLAGALGVSRQTLYDWATGRRRGEKSDRADSVKRAYQLLGQLWEDYMQNGKINPVSGIFLGKNHFGYTDKQEVTLRPGHAEEEAPTPEQLEAKYADVIVDDVLEEKSDG